MRIQHNIMAMNAYRNYNNNVNAMKSNLEKLSSGYKINRAGDDAAGLAISEKMRAQITGLSAAQKNVKDGISLVQTAEGAMQEVQDMLNRMVYLATQSANGTYDNEVDRLNLQKEVDQLKTEIDRISDSANFNGIKLLDGSLASTGTSTTADVDLSKLSGAIGASKTVDAVKGEYEMKEALLAADQAVAEGDTLSATFTVKDANGKIQEITINLTAAKDTAGDVKLLVAEDGTEYALTAKDKASAADWGAAVLGELQKNSTIKENFTVSHAAGKITLKAKTAGTQGMQVTGVEAKHIAKTGTETVTATGMTVKTKATDAFETIDLNNAKIWDGLNGKKKLEDCIFEINGEKFVFVNDAATVDLKDADQLAALHAAGVEHFVQVTTKDTIANADVTEMAKKISMETGLKVEAGATTAAGDGYTWAAGTTGTEIALKSNTVGKTGGGLRLQIGDTPEDFNQLKVVIGDIHVKALGIADVDIGDQDGAAAAIDKIKAAINYVSGIRGDLGAAQNRLEHTSNNLAVMQENIQDAESSIRDTDVADEMMSYTKNNILIQSAQAMLAQANQIPQGVLQLLQ